jgi:hypothetical protein
VLLSDTTIANGPHLLTARHRASTQGAGDRVAGVSGSSLSRRALLRAGGAGLVGATALAGCDLDPDSSSAPPSSSAPDPDQHVVESARRELRGLVSRLSATGAAGLVAVHRAQLAALQGDPPPTTARSRPLTPAQAVAREKRAAERFTRWAATCQNGDLARVLASIAAGIRMQPVLKAAR